MRLVPVPSPRGHSIGIDVKSQIAALIASHGTYILYRRAVRSYRCSCWDIARREADPQCVWCFGTGWPVHEHLRKAISQSVIEQGTRATAERQASYGVVFSPNKAFIVTPDCRPKRDDVIVELDSDEARSAGFASTSQYARYLGRNAVQGHAQLRHADFQHHDEMRKALLTSSKWDINLVTPKVTLGAIEYYVCFCRGWSGSR